MFNLFELMQKSQGGEAVQAMAKQFGLSPPQAESAMDALLPAFTVALQRQMQDPQAMMSLFGAMAQAQQQAMMNAATNAMNPDKSSQPAFGGDMLGAFFGSSEITRAVAAQAAAVSGISPQILQQMLPAMASMLTAGMMKSFSEGGLAGILAPMMKNFGAGAPQGGLGNGLSGGIAAYQDMVGKMMDAALPTPPPPPKPEPEPAPPNPFDPAGFAELMGRMMGVAAPPSEPEAEREPPPPPPTAGELGFDALTQMVETGRDVQDQQMKAMQAIFNQMLSKTEKT